MDRRKSLITIKKPVLRNPYLICGISGWVDGGEAATGIVRYLTRKLKAKKFAEMPIERFHVFQVPGESSSRPEVKIEDGVILEHHFPQNQFFYWVNNDSPNDLILFLGTEPSLNWEEYTDDILRVVNEYKVARIYLLGGVLDKTPHTREPNVSCACSSKELRMEMQKYAVQFSNYEGPGSFATTLLYVCQNKGIPAVSMMARATYYPEYNVIVTHNPKSIRAILKRLNPLLSLNLDFSDLDVQAKEFEEKMGFMVSHNPGFQAYVAELEKGYIEVKYDEPLDISPSEAIRIAEELLKKKGN
jgi:proteasome assembly chaperone (PAC2) family protein